MQMCDFIFFVKPLSCCSGKQTDKIDDADVVEHTAVHGKIKHCLPLLFRFLYLLKLFDIIKKIRLLGHNDIAEESSSLADDL